MMNKENFRSLILMAIAAGLFLISNVVVAYGQSDSLPRPRLIFKGKADTMNNGYESVTYRLDVENKTDYPKELFEAAPDLPPCGTNKNSSRSWVNIYAQGGRRIYGYCGIKSPDELSKMAFIVPKGTTLDYVYIVIHDRKTNRELRSNMVSTTN